MKKNITVKFWGVRGSIPIPGESTRRYGGNTSCVSVSFGNQKTIIFDAGTGIRELGKVLVENSDDIFVLITHMHWDHIQGFPFFGPIFQKNRVIYVYSDQAGDEIFNPLFLQMDGAHFPVSISRIPSKCRLITEDITSFMYRQGFNVSQIANNHPGGACSYRIENDNRSVVYMTDNELFPPAEKSNDYNMFVEFCKGADVLIHDAQYLERDLPHKHGWGHSLVSQAVDLAEAAEVKQLVLFHHDPDRTDEELDIIQKRASIRLQESNNDIVCTAAYEGLAIDI